MNRPVVKEITVIEVQWTAGAGVPNDPVRIIYSYFTPDGTLLAGRDTWFEPEPGTFDSERLRNIFERKP